MVKGEGDELQTRGAVSGFIEFSGSFERECIDMRARKDFYGVRFVVRCEM